MGWYPCCCGGAGCSACDCFPCGVRFKLSDTPAFKCSSSYLTDELFNSEWVYANVTELSPNRCRAEYVVAVDTQPDITVPPGPPASPPYTCGSCVVSTGIMTVRVVINIYGQSNCTVPCSDADFGGASVCQFCGFQYDVSIYVEPLIAGSVTQDNEEWNAIGEQQIDPDRCDDWVSEASTRGYPICPVDPAETYKLQHLNLDLCPGGPILDFSDITVTLEPVKDERNYLGQDCDGVTAGCACWWQFNPVSPQTPPCTPTTDPSFVNCIDVTFGTGWQETDWDENGTIPSTDGWWSGYTTLNCSDLDNRILRAVNDASVTHDYVPCHWSDFFVYNPTGRAYNVGFYLDVVQASEILFRLGTDACWDSVGGIACTSINSWLVPDPALATFANYKFRLRVVTSQSSPGGPINVFGKYVWLSQNSFALTDVWTNGAIAGNPLKPFSAVAYQENLFNPTNCADMNYSMTKCIFTAVGAITFPTKRYEEMHCHSKHNIPDVTIGPVACPP